MGIFNHLFGSKSDIAREAKVDAHKMALLWREHVVNSRQMDEHSRFFSYENVDYALEHPDELYAKLDEIEKLISKDLVNVEDEIKTEEEILGDVKRLLDGRIGYLIHRFHSVIERQKAMYNILRRDYEILVTILHAISSLRKKLNRELLLGLYKLIFHELPILLNGIANKNHPNWEDLNKLTMAVLLEEQLEEDLVALAENNFVSSVVEKMDIESENKFRKFGDRMISELLSLAKRQMPEDWDMGHIIGEVGKMMRNDNLMYQIAIDKKGRLKLSGDQLKLVIKAFREAYSREHFEDVLADFLKRPDDFD